LNIAANIFLIESYLKELLPLPRKKPNFLFGFFLGFEVCEIEPRSIHEASQIVARQRGAR